MTDQPALPAPEQPQLEANLASTMPRSRQRNVVPWLYGFGFLMLAAAIFYLWQHPSVPAETVADMTDIRAVEQKLQAVDTRLAHLEQQPKVSPTVDLEKIAERLATLEAHVSDQARLASQVDVLSGRIQSLSGREQTGLDVLKQQLDHDAGRLTNLEKTGDGLKAVSDRVDRIVRIEAASVALAAGQPLGELPGAPAALSQYAHAAPPTMAHLRLAFPQIERAALAAGQSSSASGPFIDRVWERAQGLVTIRQGDAVVIGNASAVGLAQAKIALDAGDLAAAIDATAALSPDVVHAAAIWLTEARALLNAQIALADLAAHI